MSLTPEMIADGWKPWKDGPTPEDATAVLFASGLVRHIYEMISPWPPSRYVTAYKPESPSHDQ